MSILEQVNTQPVKEGLRIVIAGQEKMGKTTLACDAPGALLVPLEIGYQGVTVAKVPMMQQLSTVHELLDELIALLQKGEQLPCQSLVFDSATALERFIHTSILAMEKANDATMESALGGYGKAYTFANQKFQELLQKFDYLAVYGGVNIILTCHVFASEVIDPNAGKYDCWDILLHSPKNQKTYGKREMLTQWADIVGFLYEPMYVTKGDDMNKAVSANAGRVLGVQRTPSYVAGNRFGVTAEMQIPLESGWNALAQAVWIGSKESIDIWKR